MRRKRFCKFLLALMIPAATLGCSATLPVDYTAKSFVDVGDGKIAMGDFQYTPALQGDVKANQLQNTAAGNIFIGTTVENFVREATALEIEKAGINATDRGRYIISGDVKSFLLDDLGYSVDWSYSVKYTVVDTESNRKLLDKTYFATPVTTGKFGLPGDYTPTVNQMLRSAINQMLRDLRELKIFDNEVDAQTG